MVSAATTIRPVLHLLDALLEGGAERVAVQLATRADRGRFAPAVACFRQEAPSLAEELAAAGRPLHVVPKRRAFDVRLVLALRRLIRREGIAQVHCHDLQSATYGALAGKLTRVPAVLTVHGLGIFRQRRSAFLMPRLGRWMSRVVFVGHWLERVAAEELGVRPRHAMVIHNGVDVAAFDPGPPDPALAGELGIEPGRPVVGTVGNLREVKDHPTLVRGFTAALARVPDAVLVFVGDGPKRPALEALARGLGVEGNVRFAGARSDVARVLRAFDVFALSSKTEGISIALLEAMAAGLPAVATETGGNPEVIVEGETGCLVPVADAERLGEALAALLSDPGRRAAWGRAARARAEGEFSLDRMVSDYESVYESLIERR